MSIASDIAAYNGAVNTDITTKVAVDSITPSDVGGALTDLATLLLPYIQTINTFNVSGGSGTPVGGADTDLYFQGATNQITVWRNVGGTWTSLAVVPIGFTIPDGPLTIRDFIAGFNVTVTTGSFAVANVVYQMLTQTAITVDPADVNYFRYDAILGKDDNTVAYLAGTAASSPAYPSAPSGSIIIDYVIVPPSSSGVAPYLLYSNGNAPGASTTGLVKLATTAGSLVIDWQNDIPSGYSDTYATLLGNNGLSVSGNWDNSGTYENYNPTLSYTMTGGLIDTVTISDLLDGFIIIT